jgi:hypothetical protein
LDNRDDDDDEVNVESRGSMLLLLLLLPPRIILREPLFWLLVACRRSDCTISSAKILYSETVQKSCILKFSIPVENRSSHVL